MLGHDSPVLLLKDLLLSLQLYNPRLQYARQVPFRSSLWLLLLWTEETV
jgi:hypothetical protein